MQPSKKIRIAFVYMPCAGLTKNYFFTTSHHFFMTALKRNPDIEISYFPSEKSFDAMKLKGKFDVILLFEDKLTPCSIEKLVDIKKTGIPVVVRTGDLQETKHFDISESQEKYGITAYFGYYAKDFFYEYYPKDCKYKTIFFGLESSLYQNLQPFSKRIKNRILNSGAIGNTKTISKIINRIKNRDNALHHYYLRTICNKLPYVDYTPTLEHEYTGDKYPLLLQKYRASIAATTASYTAKYIEISAAGCLTFMEVTERNLAHTLNFQDGKSAIFINEKNYEKKFEEYLESPDDPIWEQIANSGREHVLQNFTNDHAVNSLVKLFQEVI